MPLPLTAFRLPVFLVFAALASSQTTFDQLAASASQAREGNQIPQAIQFYRSALKLKPDWPEGLFFLGSLLYDSDQFSAAEAVLDHFVAVSPEPGPALGLLGLCEFETGHYAQALIHIEKTPPQDGQMGAVLRFHQAQLLTKAGDYEKALQQFSGFLRGSEAPDAVVLPLGIAALRQPLAAAEITPAQRDLYVAAGQTAAAILSGDAEQSQPRLAALLAQYPNASGVHCMKAFYLIAQDPATAMNEFKAELAIDPANASANEMLSWMLLNDRDAAGALPYAKTAISAAPQDKMAEYVYGRALSEVSEVKQGIPYLEKAVEADAGNLEAHLALASAYSKAGRIEDARRERQRSIQLAHEVAPVFVH